MSVWTAHVADLWGRGVPLSRVLEVLQGVCPRCGGFLEDVYFPGRIAQPPMKHRPSGRMVLTGPFLSSTEPMSVEDSRLWHRALDHSMLSGNREDEHGNELRACSVCRRCGADKMDPCQELDDSDVSYRAEMNRLEKLVEIVNR